MEDEQRRPLADRQQQFLECVGDWDTDLSVAVRGLVDDLLGYAGLKFADGRIPDLLAEAVATVSLALQADILAGDVRDITASGERPAWLLWTPAFGDVADPERGELQ